MLDFEIFDQNISHNFSLKKLKVGAKHVCKTICFNDRTDFELNIIFFPRLAMSMYFCTTCNCTVCNLILLGKLHTPGNLFHRGSH